MCCLQFILHMCVLILHVCIYDFYGFFCSVLFFCLFFFLVYCDIFGLLWRGLVFRLVSCVCGARKTHENDVRIETA